MHTAYTNIWNERSKALRELRVARVVLSREQQATKLVFDYFKAVVRSSHALKKHLDDPAAYKAEFKASKHPHAILSEDGRTADKDLLVANLTAKFRDLSMVKLQEVCDGLRKVLSG